MKSLELLSLLNEAKDQSFLILTDDPDSETAAKLIKESGGHGVLVSKAFISDKDIQPNKLTIHNYDGNGKKLSVDPKNTCLIVRGSCMSVAGTTLMEILESAGCFTINEKKSMELCRNKLATNLVLHKNKIDIPPSAFVSDEDSIDIALEAIGGKFPVIIKTLTGAEGVGVVKVDSYESLKSTAQALWKQGASLLIQKYYPIKYDTRTLVMDGKVLGSMNRYMSSSDFRSNVAQGGSFKPVKLDSDTLKIVEKAAKITGCFFCGVDTINHDGKTYVLEVNGSPGSGAKYMTQEGIVMDGKAMIAELIKYVKNNRDRWRYPNRTAGVIEYTTLEGLDTMKAKLDTGNSTYNVLHATDIKVEGKKVSFKTVGGKEFIKDLYDIKNIKPSNDVQEERPVITFNMSFDGKSFPNTPFSLADRDNHTYPILIGKVFLSNHHYAVDASDKFMLSESSRASRIINILSEDNK